MGPWGALVMGFFGSVFGAAAILLAGLPLPWLIPPVLVFAVIAAIAWRRIGRAAPGTFMPDSRASKIISRASMGEGAGIAVVALGLANTGHQNLVLPGVAAVVGLHFLPMAYAIPFRRFYLPAAILLAAALAGFLLPQPRGAILAGGAAALALWSAAFLGLVWPHRDGARDHAPRLHP